MGSWPAQGEEVGGDVEHTDEPFSDAQDSS